MVNKNYINKARHRQSISLDQARMERAVRTVIYSHDGMLKNGPLEESDKRRFIEFLIFPPVWMDAMRRSTRDFAYYQSRADEREIPSKIWGEVYPGWNPIREIFNHDETRLLYWLSSGIDVHFPSAEAARIRERQGIPAQQSADPNTKEEKSAGEEFKRLQRFFDGRHHGEKELTRLFRCPEGTKITSWQLAERRHLGVNLGAIGEDDDWSIEPPPKKHSPYTTEENDETWG